MNFSIEAPGEANPLTSQTILKTLQAATSSDQHQIQTGTQQLQTWEKTSGYYSTLQSVYIDTTLPQEVRYLAIIQLKNGVDKYWRKTATNAISKDEKDLIRSRCLDSCLNEPDAWLSLQSALMIARVVRYEYPNDWPDAIPCILGNLRLNSQASRVSFRLSRSLLTLLYVIKELSTARLQRSRAALQNAAPSITEVLFTVYSERVQKWMQFLLQGGDDEGGAMDSMEQSLLALRALRRLVVQYEFPNRDQRLQVLWSTVNAQFGSMLPLLSTDKSSALQPIPQTAIECHLLQVSKLHLHMVKSHPAAFALLPDSVNLAQSYWMLARQFSDSYGLSPDMLGAKIGSDGDEEEDLPFREKLTLQGLLILRACGKMVFNPTQTFKYQHAQDKEERRTARELLKTGLMAESFAREMMETLVTRFFVFTPRDLRQWAEEPDEWEKTQEGEGDDWEYSIRTCAEKLFLDLIIHYKEGLVPSLLSILQDAIMERSDDILRKDSTYAAIGLAASVLDTRFDFGTFLKTTLAPEVQTQKPGCNILRRRIAIVLGQWLPVKEGLDRALVYQIYQHLLDKDDVSNDQVVRVTAGRQLHNVLDPFEFSAEGFMPFAPTILQRLMALIQEVELIETKLALLTTISIIVVKMEQQITPFADQIISLLPPLWSQAEDEYLMKQAILGILSGLVTSLGTDSQKYHSLILPLIQSSIEPDSETRPYLLEEALELWAAILEQTPTPASSEMVSLVQYLVPNFDTASDACRKSLEITEAYLYLIPSEILSDVLLLLHPFSDLLTAPTREVSGLVTHLIELLLRQADVVGGIAAMESLAQSLVESKILHRLLTGIKDAYDAHQTTGPNRRYPSIDGVVETDYLNVLARLAICSPNLLNSAVQTARPNSSIDWLLAEWLEHMDNISHPNQKKLNCMAVTSLLATGEPWILSRLQSLMSLWTDVITELVTDYDDGQGNAIKRDCLVYTSPDALKLDGPESPSAFLHRQLTFIDPLHRTDLRDYVREKLAAVVEGCGGMDNFRQQWVDSVDKDVVQAFGGLGIF